MDATDADQFTLALDGRIPANQQERLDTALDIVRALTVIDCPNSHRKVPVDW